MSVLARFSTRSAAVPGAGTGEADGKKGSPSGRISGLARMTAATQATTQRQPTTTATMIPARGSRDFDGGRACGVGPGCPAPGPDRQPGGGGICGNSPGGGEAGPDPGPPGGRFGPGRGRGEGGRGGSPP